MADQTTTNLGLIKPTPSDPGGANTWGVKLNQNMDTIDAAIAAILSTPGHRLSLQSGNPVASSDVPSTSSLYYTPHRHGYAPVATSGSLKVMKYVGEVVCQLSDSTLSPAPAVAGGVYDVFLWNNAGTYVLSRGPAWQSASTRAATGAIARDAQGYISNSFDITNGPTSRQGLYVGTIMCDATGPTCSLAFGNVAGDTATKAGFIGLQNAFNSVRGSTLSCEYSSAWATVGPAAGGPPNNNVKLRATLVRGSTEEKINIEATEYFTTGNVVGVGSAMNATTTAGSITSLAVSNVAIGSGTNVHDSKHIVDYTPTLGVSYYQQIESGFTSGANAQGGNPSRTYLQARFSY